MTHLGHCLEVQDGAHKVIGGDGTGQRGWEAHECASGTGNLWMDPAGQDWKVWEEVVNALTEAWQMPPAMDWSITLHKPAREK